MAANIPAVTMGDRADTMAITWKVGGNGERKRGREGERRKRKVCVQQVNILFTLFQHTVEFYLKVVKETKLATAPTKQFKESCLTHLLQDRGRLISPDTLYGW